MPSDFVLKAMNVMHRSVMTLSRNRLGWSAGDMVVLELTTTGRKTGEPRKVLLTSPYAAGSDLVLVASRGGDNRHPACGLNLCDNPEVEVKLRDGVSRRMHARVASTQERATLWPAITAKHPFYGDYQAKTRREIPLVVLESMHD